MCAYNFRFLHGSFIKKISPNKTDKTKCFTTNFIKQMLHKNLIVFCHFSKKTTIFAKTKTANKWHT